MFWRNNEEKVTISGASLTVSNRKPVFGRVSKANATISEANEIDSCVCLTSGQERAFYLRNSYDERDHPQNLFIVGYNGGSQRPHCRATNKKEMATYGV